MSTWRYAISRDNVAGEDVWSIREIYYDDEGNLEMWSADPMHAKGETWAELDQDFGHMNDAMNTGIVLDLTQDPPSLIHRSLLT